MERHRKITPTDIDGLIDYNGNSFVYIEGKYYTKTIEFGQKRALENLVNSHNKAGNLSCAIIFVHNSPIDEIIMVKDQLIFQVYYNGKWSGKWQEKEYITVLGFIEKWEKMCLRKKIKI